MAIQDCGWIVLVTLLSITLVVAVSMLCYNSQHRFSEYNRCQQGKEFPESTSKNDESIKFSETPSPAPQPNPYSMYKHLASLAYFTRDSNDYLYRCTAIVLSPTTVLSTTKCSETYGTPASALFGHSGLMIEVKHSVFSLLCSDLVLYGLAKPIDFDQQAMSNVSVATLCTEDELEGELKLHAVGFAQNEDGTNCNLFSSRLVKSKECAKDQIKNAGLYIPRMHLCLAPIPDDSHRSQNGGCAKCLMASTSVLHVERFDGSFCVAGIAMPTTSECVVNNNPIYYTSLVSSTARKFLDVYR